MRFIALACLLGICTSIIAAENDTSSSNAPTVKWSFDDLPSGAIVGKIKTDASTLTAPEYGGFDDTNQVLSIERGSYIQLDGFDDGELDFDNGDAITVEAWVNPKSISQNAYIIGKGRALSSRTDQNWAFRLRQIGGQACVNFLFHSQSDKDERGDWHRWTSADGFSIDGEWHHVAVSYEFGKPDSLRAYLDGELVTGKWDMGGKTKRPPAQSQSPAWVGSAMASKIIPPDSISAAKPPKANGNSGNSFHGQIDELAVYRHVVAKDVLLDRYKRKPTPIIRPEVAKDSVAVELYGPLSSISAIPKRVGQRQRLWTQDSLAFTRLPNKYDSWGVRDDWDKTLLVRAWTDLSLDPGDYQLLIRSRGYSRLFVDDREIVSTPKMRNRTGAHHVVDDLPEVPVVGMRPAFMNDHERVVDFHSDGGEHVLRYEVIVGGPKYRLEFGETCVAIAKKGEMFHVIANEAQYPLTDDGWNQLAKRQSTFLEQMDRQERRTQSATQDKYWAARHQYALEHLHSGAGSGESDAASIDALIEKRIQRENESRRSLQGETDPSQQTFYQENVRPILASHCGRCHGEKKQGELAVFDRASLLSGGESGEAAVVPGDPDASSLIAFVSADPDEYRMPPKGDGLSATEIETLRTWIANGAKMAAARKPAIKRSNRIDDYAFLRRVYLDTVGVPPTLTEANAFLNDTSDGRRTKLIDELLQDDRWADNWVGYWQDALAENPNLLKPMLNNTGPFRYWIHEALVDNKPVDRFATELIQMRGSKWYGGAGGFAIASQNDVPMAAKANVIGTAFMGVEMKCARCHDAPYHTWKQSDLFSLAAMLERKSIKLPDSSTVPAAFFEHQERESLINVTLKPGQTVHGEWPFAKLAPSVEARLLQDADDSRERLAAQVTASRRFAEVIANRVWQRLIGKGIVEPVDDWQGNPPCDPALLSRLADILIESNYDMKALARSILTSDVYQRESIDDDNDRFFAGPSRRRMTAEQIVDSAFLVVGQNMTTEQLTLDVEGTLPADRFMNFGFPKHSWEFSTLANERDRPSLALPRVQAVTDVLQAFGWRNSRPEPTSARDESANLIQPGALANGTLGIWLTRLSDQSGLTDMMLSEQPVDQLVDQLFLRMLTREPTSAERKRFVRLLRPGYENRSRSLSMADAMKAPQRFRYVSWSNHLNTEANVIKVQMQELARKGPDPTKRLVPEWREKAEDAVWALLNSPEMIMLP